MVVHFQEKKSSVIWVISMKYTWRFNEKAFKQFKKEIDRPVQKRIIEWLDSHIEGSDDPRKWGKALEGNLGTWSYCTKTDTDFRESADTANSTKDLLRFLP